VAATRCHANVVELTDIASSGSFSQSLRTLLYLALMLCVSLKHFLRATIQLKVPDLIYFLDDSDAVSARYVNPLEEVNFEPIIAATPQRKR
jgi:hypothetical protein